MTISELFIKVNELNKNDDIERIRLVIDSSGESAEPLFDELMRCISISEKPVDIINIGGCAEPACVALYASATGRRYAFRDTFYKLISRKLRENRSEIEKLLEFKIERYAELMMENTGLPEEYYSKENGVTFFTVKEAEKYGLITEIITKLP
jgi:ATP-dependent protease ClpP protease subunit